MGDGILKKRAICLPEHRALDTNGFGNKISGGQLFPAASFSDVSIGMQ